MAWPALIAMAVQAGLSAIGEANSAAERDKARKALEKALAGISNIDDPQLQQVLAEQLGPSALEGVQGDPESIQAQKNVLARLMELESNGGMTLEDQAVLNKITNKTARQAQASNAAVKADMAARGVGGSGAELAMQLANNQAAAERANQGGMDIAAAAQRRYLDSLRERAGLSGQMRQQNFAERSQAAKAKDEIARYNATARERAKYYNAGLPQQQADWRLRKASAAAGMAPGIAGQHNQSAQDSRAFWSGLGATAGRGIYDYSKSKNDPYAGTPSYDPVQPAEKLDEDEYP